MPFQTSCQSHSLPRPLANTCCDFTSPEANPWGRGKLPRERPSQRAPSRGLWKGKAPGLLQKGRSFPSRFNSWPLLYLLPAVPAGDRNDSILVAVSPVPLSLRIEQLYFSAAAKSPRAYDITEGNPSLLLCRDAVSFSTAKEVHCYPVCRACDCWQPSPGGATAAPKLADALGCSALQKEAAIHIFANASLYTHKSQQGYLAHPTVLISTFSCPSPD